MSRELTLSQLTTELTDFLALPEDLDLPPIGSITCRRTHDTGWKVQGWISASTDEETYARIAAWARYTGGVVQADGKPYAAGHQPSGMQRTLMVAVVVAEVPIELKVGVDALFAVPAAEAVSV